MACAKKGHIHLNTRTYRHTDTLYLVALNFYFIKFFLFSSCCCCFPTFVVGFLTVNGLNTSVFFHRLKLHFIAKNSGAIKRIIPKKGTNEEKKLPFVLFYS